MKGFRVWSNFWKRYAFDAELYPDGSLYAMFEDDYGVPHHENTDLVLEFETGLKDKKGKEIYQGDIVEQFVCGVHHFKGKEYHFKGKECVRKTLWQVRWNEEECCFELHYLSGSLFGDSMMSNSDEYEVIGNIHENPELLEEK